MVEIVFYFGQWAHACGPSRQLHGKSNIVAKHCVACEVARVSFGNSLFCPNRIFSSLFGCYWRCLEAPKTDERKNRLAVSLVEHAKETPACIFAFVILIFHVPGRGRLSSSSASPFLVVFFFVLVFVVAVDFHVVFVTAIVVNVEIRCFHWLRLSTLEGCGRGACLGGAKGCNPPAWCAKRTDPKKSETRNPRKPSAFGAS